MNSNHPSRFVEPDLSEARVTRLWLNVADRLEKRRPPMLRWLAVGVAALALAGGGLLLTRQFSGFGSPERAVLAEAKLETASDTLAVTLGDGSSVHLASRTRVEVHGNQPSSVALALHRGELVCDVPHREGRSFTVTAGGVEVRVIGTRFSVKATPSGAGERVEVNVTRGVVEVRSETRPGVVARVAAGQSWAQAPAEVGSVKETAVAPPSASEPASPPVEVRELSGPGSALPTAVSPGAVSARELFERAGESRRAGDAQAAARSYEELLRSHAGDGRAALSAFELGRLRMDRLGDTAGAVQALERAVALGVGPSFREDALARLVSAYAAQGNFTACARARDGYLKSYPAGIHASAVSSRCGTR